MTLTAPTAPDTRIVGPRPGRVARLKLEHPVPLYAWPGVLFLLAVLLLHAASTPDGWRWFLLAETPAVLIVTAGLEAARRSSYSTVAVLRRVLESHRA